MADPELEQWISAFEALKTLEPALSAHSARIRICERAFAGLVRARAEQFHSGSKVHENVDVPKEFWWAKGQTALDQDWASGDFSTWIEGRLELKAFGVTFAVADIEKIVPPASRSQIKNAMPNAEDDELVAKLEALVPAAAQSYRQAISDLADQERLSFRGPALELRESLREILDHLAPDDQVTIAPGYVHEANTNGPTMKQKTRFIMKQKGKQSDAEAPVQSVLAFEEAVAALTRATYQLSSKATHRAGERSAVLQIRRYVVAVFHEIL